MRRTPALPRTLIAPLLLLAIAAFAVSWMATVAMADEHENGNGNGDALIVLRNGDGEPGYAVNAFLPETITIRTGTTVRWEFPWLEPHSTTFGEPGPVTPSGSEFDGTEPVNSGIISELFGSEELSWELVFIAEGEFEFYCLIHSAFQFMTVIVTDDPEVDVDTQASVDARGEAYYQDALGRAKDVAATLQAAPVQTETLDDGSTRWTVVNGGHTDDGHDAFLYAPSPVTITEGDTIRWVNSIPVPHTVTFGPPPAFEDPFEVPQTLPGDAYDGQGFWHSGIMFGIPGAIPGAIQTFDLKFSTPGTYNYYCLLHGPMGHQGTVVVEAAAVDPTPTTAPPEPTATPTQVAPGPPATGSGSGTGPATGMMALFGAAALLFGLTLLVFRMSRAGSRHQA